MDDIESPGVPAAMTDRELLEEIVTSQRETRRLVESFIKSLDTNPMLKMFGAKFGKK